MLPKLFLNGTQSRKMVQWFHMLTLIATYLTGLVHSYLGHFLQNCTKIVDYWVLANKDRISPRKNIYRRSPTRTTHLERKVYNNPRFHQHSSRICVQNRLDVFSESHYCQDYMLPPFYGVKISRPKRAVVSESNFSFSSRGANDRFIYPQNPPPFGVPKRYRLQKNYMSSTSIKLEEYNRKNTEYIIQKSSIAQGADFSGKRIHGPIHSKQKLWQLQFWTLSPYAEPRVRSSVHKRQKLCPFEPTKLSTIFENLAY